MHELLHKVLFGPNRSPLWWCLDWRPWGLDFFKGKMGRWDCLTLCFFGDLNGTVGCEVSSWTKCRGECHSTRSFAYVCLQDFRWFQGWSGLWSRCYWNPAIGDHMTFFKVGFSSLGRIKTLLSFRLLIVWQSLPLAKPYMPSKGGVWSVGQMGNMEVDQREGGNMEWIWHTRSNRLRPNKTGKINKISRKINVLVELVFYFVLRQDLPM